MTEYSDAIFGYGMSDAAILKTLGAQLKQMRLNQNLTQEQLSKLSGISRSTLSEIEKGNIGSMLTFVQILRALQKLEVLNTFTTESPISPLQIAKMKGKIRKRASGKSTSSLTKNESEW